MSVRRSCFLLKRIDAQGSELLASRADEESQPIVL